MKKKTESPRTKGTPSAAAKPRRVAVPRARAAGPGVVKPGELPRVEIPGLILPGIEVRPPGLDIGKPPKLEFPPAGPQLSPLEITGFLPGFTFINEKNSRDYIIERRQVIEVPGTTAFALAVLQGWTLRFSDGTAFTDGHVEFEAGYAHVFGQGTIEVSVAELNEIAKKPDKKNLVVSVRALLLCGLPRANWSAHIQWSVLLMKLKTA